MAVRIFESKPIEQNVSIWTASPGDHIGTNLPGNRQLSHLLPGLEMDECMFTNVALGGSGNFFIHKHLWSLFKHPATTSEHLDEVYSKYFAGKRSLALMHAPDRTVFPTAKARFETFAASHNLRCHRIGQVGDRAGPLFEIFEVTPDVHSIQRTHPQQQGFFALDHFNLKEY